MEIETVFETAIIDYGPFKVAVSKPVIITIEMVLEKVKAKDMQWFTDNKIKFEVLEI